MRQIPLLEPFGVFIRVSSQDIHNLPTGFMADRFTGTIAFGPAGGGGCFCLYVVIGYLSRFI